MRAIYKKIVSLGLSYSLVTAPLYASGIQTDGTTATSMDKAMNNVPIVNIANPNAQGLSHNKFQNYNVEKEGVILNNSMDTTVRTQLSGYIFGNSNLTSNAKVILNEVTSTNRTYLRGYTEVAGQKADLVIANPNGITINGAGFINTSHVTLSTGTPLFNQGKLHSFDVIGGDIALEGDGLDAMGQDSVALYSYSMLLNAEIHAKDLEIRLGQNKIDYETKEILESSHTNGVGLILDSSALGGMYAERIKLIGTDKGLGVNMPQEVLASYGDIVISNNGQIKLQKTTAKENITINANEANIVVEDTVTSGVDMHLQADDVINNALLNSGNDMTLAATNLYNNQTLFSGNDMSLYVENELMNNENANIFALNNLTLAKNEDNEKTLHIVNNKGTIQAYNGDLIVYAENLKNLTDDPVVQGKYVKSSGSVAKIENGILVSNTNKKVGSGNDYDLVNTKVEIMVLESKGKASEILAGNDIHLYADNITNKFSLIAANGDVYLDVQSINNNEVEIIELTTTTKKLYRSVKCNCKYGGHDCDRCPSYRGTQVSTSAKVLEKVPSTIQAGGSIKGNVVTLTNGTVKQHEPLANKDNLNQTLTKIMEEDYLIGDLNDYALFTKTKNPSSEYLIETNQNLQYMKIL